MRIGFLFIKRQEDDLNLLSMRCFSKIKTSREAAAACGNPGLSFRFFWILLCRSKKLIKDFINEHPLLFLFTRLRHIGETLNIDMLWTIFKKTGKDTSVLAWQKYQRYFHCCSQSKKWNLPVIGIITILRFPFHKVFGETEGQGNEIWCTKGCLFIPDYICLFCGYRDLKKSARFSAAFWFT